MIPLFYEQLKADSRALPRAFLQVDWSNGGDGIVVRKNIRSVADLKGKSIALAQHSPSHYLILNLLINAGLQPSDVDFRFTEDAFQAAAAFNADKSLAACVSWAPDIYKLSEAPGNKLLVITATANKLIADVMFARADFVRDNPKIVDGLVRGFFDAVEELKDEANTQKAAALMAKAYGLPADEAAAMLGDAHSTNYAENKDVLPQPEQPDELRALLGDGEHALPEARLDRQRRALRPGDGLLLHQGARGRRALRQLARRVHGLLHPQGGVGDQGRGRRDPHQRPAHPLLPQLLRPLPQERGRHALRPQRRQGPRGGGRGSPGSSAWRASRSRGTPTPR